MWNNWEVNIQYLKLTLNTTIILQLDIYFQTRFHELKTMNIFSLFIHLFSGAIDHLLQTWTAELLALSS